MSAIKRTSNTNMIDLSDVNFTLWKQFKINGKYDGDWL
jgi:hypothetical protein